MSESESDSGSETDDWDADFASEETRKESLNRSPLPSTSPAPLKITGVVAKATDEIEDWDRDFLDEPVDHADLEPQSPRLSDPLLTALDSTSHTIGSRAGMSIGDSGSRVRHHTHAHSRFGMHVRGRHKSLASDRLDALAQRLLRLRSAAYSLCTDDAAKKVSNPPLNTVLTVEEEEVLCTQAQQALSEARDEVAAVRAGVALSEAHWRSGHFDAAQTEAQNALRALDGLPSASSGSLSLDERAHLRARMLLVQGRGAHAQLDSFKAARALKQAASTLAEADHRDEALHTLVHFELAQVLDDKEQSSSVADALIVVVSGLLTLGLWTSEQTEHMVSSAVRLAEYALRCEDQELARLLVKGALAIAARSTATNAIWSARARALQRDLSGGSDASAAKGSEESRHESDGEGIESLHDIDDSDEASDWDLELSLSLTAADEEGTTSGVATPTRTLKRTASPAAANGSPRSIIPPPSTNLDAARESDSGSDWDKEFADSDEDSSAAPAPSVSAVSVSNVVPQPKPLRPRVLQAQQRAASRRALLSLSQPPRIDVKRYEILPEKNFKAVKYPPPTFLYSLRTRENHKLMNESQLEEWLQSLQLRQKDLLQSKNQPPSLKDLDVATETFLRGHHAHWAWQTLATEGMLAWEPVAKAFEKLDKHIQSSSKRKEAGGVDFDRFESSMADLVYFVIRHASSAQIPEALGVLRVFAEYSPNSRPLSRLFEGALYGHHLVHNPIGIFCKVYSRAKRSEPPLNPRDLLSLDDFSAVGLQARALAYLHLYLIERSPLSTAKQTTNIEVSDESSEDEIIDQLCSGDDYRIKLLTDLYPYLKPSVLKAECAYVLALHAVDKNDLALAEKVSFEVVYILAVVPSSVKGLSPLLTELGSNALALYADVLRSNAKYKYAALAFEAALSILRVLGKSDEYNALLESFAKIAHAENDLRRSVSCYTEIVFHYQQQQLVKDRRNEIIYVSEILGTMFVELGDFISAEGYIKTALQFFPEKDPSESRPTDPTFIRLQILLAHTFLLSYSFEKGITLLESILTHKLPLKQEKQVTEMLLSAYRKKGWVKEGYKLLESFKSLVDLEEKEVGAQNTSDTIKFWKLAALHFFKSEQYKPAMCCVDKAIMTTDTSSFAVLGRLYLLRGKILLEMYKHPGSVSFPTSFQPDQKLEIAGETLTTTISYTTFTSQGDLIQECIATFKQASFYFEGTGDDVHLAQTMTYTSEVLLEVCFPPVALYDATFVDISSLPYFHPSFIAQNTREAQKRKREQQEHRRQKTMQRESERLKEKRRLRETKRSAYLPNPIASPKEHSSSPSQFSGFTNFILPKSFVSNDSNKRRTTGDPFNASTSDKSESAFLNGAHTTQIYVEPDREVLLVLVLGWRGVGRTSIMTRLVKGTYYDHVPPSSQDEISDLLIFQGRKVRFLSPQLSPTEPLDRLLERLPKKQLRGILLCYDVTVKDSFSPFVEWWQSSSIRNLPAVLVGNRAGEGEQRQVLQTQVGEWVSLKQLKCFDVSAKEGLGLDEALSTLIEGIDCAILEQDVIPIQTLETDLGSQEPSSQIPPISAGSGSTPSPSLPSSITTHIRSLPAVSARSRSGSQGHSRNIALESVAPSSLPDSSPVRVNATYSQSKSDAEDSESESNSHEETPTHKRALSTSDGAPLGPLTLPEDGHSDNLLSPANARSKLLQLPAQFVVGLDQVREATELALDLSNDCAQIFLLLRGYLNMAELQFLEGDTNLALQFWEQCARHVVDLFEAKNQSIFREAPPSGLRKLLSVVRRTLRFLVCQSKELINAHLRLVDFYHLLLQELDAALRRDLPAMETSRLSSSALTQGAALLSRRRLSGQPSSSSSPPYVAPNILPGGGSPSGPLLPVPNPGRDDREKRLSFRQSLSHALDFTRAGSARLEAEAIFAEGERIRAATSKKCALAWGFLHFVKQQGERYTEGKLSLDALRTTSQRSYRKMAKIAEMLRRGDTESLLDTTDTPRMRRRKRHGQADTSTEDRRQSDATSADTVELEYRQPGSQQNALQRLVLILQLDEHIVYYASGSGRRRVQRLAPRTLTTSMSSGSAHTPHSSNGGLTPSMTSSLAVMGPTVSEEKLSSADLWVPLEVTLLNGSSPDVTSTLLLSVRASCSLQELHRFITHEKLAEKPLFSLPSTLQSSNTPGNKERSKTKSLFSIFTPLFGISDKKEKEKDKEKPTEHEELVRILARDDEFSTLLRLLTSAGSPPMARAPLNANAPSKPVVTKSRGSDSDDSENSGNIAEVRTPPQDVATKEDVLASSTSWTSRIRLARRTGASLSSLHARMTATLRDVFSVGEIHRAQAGASAGRGILRIVAYCADDVRALKSVQDDAVLLSEPLQRYLTNVALSASSDSTTPREAVAREFRHTFSGLSDVLPASRIESDRGLQVALSGFATIRGDAWRVKDPDEPLVFLCSPALQAVPWELLLEDAVVVRTFALREHLRSRSFVDQRYSLESEKASEKARTTEVKEKALKDSGQALKESRGDAKSSKESKEIIADEVARLAQTLWVAAPAQSRAVIEAEIAARKMSLKKRLLHSLRLVRRYELPRPPTARWPLPSVLVTRSSSLLRHESVRSLECSGDPVRTLAHTGNGPARLFSTSNGPILVLGLSDLLEMSDALMLIRSHPSAPTLLFVPDANLKHVVRTLLKAHAVLLKRAKSERGLLRCDMLLETLRGLLHDDQIPLALFNTPWGH